MQTATKPGYTLGELARMWGLPTWTVRRIYERKRLPEPGRVGIFRVVLPGDVAALRAELVLAGYLKPEAVEAKAS